MNFTKDEFDKSKFIIEGNAYISDVGIASNISINNYLQSALKINPQTNLTIEIAGTHGAAQTGAGVPFYITDGTNNLMLYRNNKNALSGEVGAKYPNADYLLDITTTNNTDYKFIVSFDIQNNKYTTLYYENDILQSKNENIDIARLALIDWSKISLFKIGGAYQSLNGTINLVKFSISVDGDVIFKTVESGSNLVYRFAPDIYSENETMLEIYERQNQQLDNTSSLVYQVFLNNYVKTCDLEGIRNFEKIFDIQADEKNDSMDLRKNRVLIKLSQHLPFTHIFVERMLVNIFGEDKTEFRVLNNEYKTQVDIETTIHGLVDETLKDLRQIIPANMIIEIILSEPYMHRYLAKYYTYGQLEEFTYGQLSQYA